MSSLRRLLLSAIFAWAFVAALAVIFLRSWLRERFGRGGPIPVSQARMLLTPFRELIHPARATLEAFGIKSRDTVLELGPGPGYFTVEAARIVGSEGRVLCLDVQPGMLGILRGRLAAHDVTNAHPVAADAARLPLAGASVDAAFLVTVLGEIPDRPAALAELRRVMRPGAVLSVMETLTDPDYVLEGHARDLCRSHGFEPVHLLRQRLGYAMTFRAVG